MHVRGYERRRAWTRLVVDLSPSVTIQYSGPRKTSVKTTIDQRQHDPVDDLAARRLSWREIRVRVGPALRGGPVLGRAGPGAACQVVT